MTHTHDPSSVSELEGPVHDEDAAIKAPAGLLRHLQAAAGNRAVAGLVQRAARPSPPLPLSVQRFVDRTSMEKMAGPPSSRAVKKHSTYVQILEGIQGYHDQVLVLPVHNQTQELRDRHLLAVEKLVVTWLQNHKEADEQKRFLLGLQDDLVAERTGVVQDRQSISPSEVHGAWERSKAGIREADFNVESPEKIDAWRLTVVAAVEHEDYLAFAEERYMARRKKENKGLKGVKKQEHKEALAKKVLLEKARRRHKDKKAVVDDTSEQFMTEVRLLAGAGVGHTYIKLSVLSGQALRSTSSFGFYPAVGVSSPKESVPGNVVHPDRAHENKAGESRRFLDYPVTKVQHEAGMSKAKEIAAAPPTYEMWAYNCTRFAKDVAEAAGQKVPGDYKMVPKVSGIGLTKAYSPNATFSALDGGEGTYDESTDDQLFQQSNAPQQVQQAPQLHIRVFQDSDAETETGRNFQAAGDFRIQGTEDTNGFIEVYDVANQEIVWVLRDELVRDEVPIVASF